MSLTMKCQRDPALANRRRESSSARWPWALIVALCLVVSATPARGQGAATVGVRLASHLDGQTAAWLQASILETLAVGETRPQVEPSPMQLSSYAANPAHAGVELTLYGDDPALPLVVHRISRGRLATLQAQADASGQTPRDMALAVVVPGTVAPLATPPSETDIVVYPLAGQRLSPAGPSALAPLQFWQRRSPATHRLASPLTEHRLPMYYPGIRAGHTVPPPLRDLWPALPWMPSARHAPFPEDRWWLLDPGPAWPP